ncbi:MAG: hypothetical protein FJW31_09375 [Acidobacteria bacterium]|nr:hypothetical protein [Acidobacteriota bacterium]
MSEQPARLEIEVELETRVFQYSIALEFPAGFKEMRVLDERLEVDGSTVYSRELAQVRLGRTKRETEFRIDWHLAALPIIQEQSESDPLFIFQKWLSHMLILRPAPGLINGDSQAETLQPNIQVTDVGDWFSGVLALAPGAYTHLDNYLKQVMPDFKDINPPQRNLWVNSGSGNRPRL